MTVPLRIASLHTYPIKSCAGIRLTEATVLDTGFEHDRDWMVISEGGWFITQRQYPRMALIRPRLHQHGIELTAPGMEAVHVPAILHGQGIRVRIWAETTRAVDQGDGVADWLGRWLGRRCRLVRIQEARPLPANYQRAGTDAVHFADRAPLLVTSQASLDDLNARLETPVAMSRFRPNIVVAGGTAFEEDDWKAIDVNGSRFKIVQRCPRCEIITIDQETGTKDVEPMETLGSYRMTARGVLFGQRGVPEGGSRTVRVGDTVEVRA